MKTYGQFCPVAQALEVLAERWTLLVVRELLMGSSRFTELERGVPLMSRTLLSQRLRTLQEFGVVERNETPTGPKYRLTPAGEALRPIIESIGFWGKRFAGRDLPEEHLDPKLLMWDLHRNLHRDRLPEQRTVVLFRFSDARRGERRFWLCVDREIVDVCYQNPGYEVDLIVDTDVRTLTEVWRGDRSLSPCLQDGTIRLDGPTGLKRAFPSWLALSMFAAAD